MTGSCTAPLHTATARLSFVLSSNWDNPLSALLNQPRVWLTQVFHFIDFLVLGIRAIKIIIKVNAEVIAEYLNMLWLLVELIIIRKLSNN